MIRFPDDSRSILADLDRDADPGPHGWTDDERAEYEAWLASLDPADVAEDPDAASMYSWHEGRAVEREMAELRAAGWGSEVIDYSDVPF